MKAGHKEKFDVRDGTEGTEERVMECRDTMIRLVVERHEEAVTSQVDSIWNSRCDAAMAMLSGDIDESASEVGVYGIVHDVFLRQGVESNALGQPMVTVFSQ